LQAAFELARGASFVGIFLLIGAQTSWILRPYIGTPGQETVLFTREREGGLVVQLWQSVGKVLDRSSSVPSLRDAP
jgi:hypothetical protein